MKVNDKFQIVILESSDIHGYVLPINYGDNSKKNLGFAKLATIIKEERRKNEKVILIDNGDILQGTPLTYYYSNINSKDINPIIKIMNHLKYDAAVVGNHEFNYGKKLLIKSVEESNFPWLSSNIIDKNTQEPFFGKPYIIKSFENGLKLAVLGATTQYIPNWENEHNIEGMSFENVIPHIRKWVKYLKEEEGAHIIVVSYHGGFERNIETGEAISNTGENQAFEICENVPGIDILLTGHQHRLIERKFINGVLVVQPGSQGQALGKVTLKVEKNNEGFVIKEKDSKLIFSEKVKAEQEIIELVKEYEEGTQKWLDTPIGIIEGDMTIKDPMRIRLRDNAFIEFLNKVQMEAAKVDISATSLFDNAAKGFKRKVTMRDIVSNYIYPNTLKVIKVKGRDIKEALERSACYFERYDGKGVNISKGFTHSKVQHYNYDMWEGIEYKIDISKEEGNRVSYLNYKGKPMDMDKEYDVVMNNYRAGGGGEYRMFKDKPVVKEVDIDMAELIAKYIMNNKVIKATVDDNWRVVY